MKLIKKIILTLAFIDISYLLSMKQSETDDINQSIRMLRNVPNMPPSLVNLCANFIAQTILDPKNSYKFDFKKHQLPKELEKIIESNLYKYPKIWQILKNNIVYKGLSSTKYSGTLGSIAISNNNKFIVIGYKDKTAMLWDVETVKCIKKFTGNKNRIDSVAISGDNRFIATESYGTVNIWQITEYQQTHSKCIKTITEPDNRIKSVAISNKFLITGHLDGTLKIWSLEESCDSKTSNKKSTSQCLQTLKAHNRLICCIAISNNAGLTGVSFIVTGSFDKTAKVWFLNESGETPVQYLQTLKGHTGVVCSAAISSFIVTGSDDYTAKIWSLEGARTRDTNGESHGQRIRHPVRRSLGEDGSFSEDGCLQTLKGHRREIFSVSIINDVFQAVTSQAITSQAGDNLIITCSYDGTAKIWSIKKGEAQCLHTNTGITNFIHPVAISSDNRFILMVNDFGQICIAKINYANFDALINLLMNSKTKKCAVS